MLTNSKAGNNKSGLGYSKKNDKKSSEPVFVKSTNQKPGSQNVNPKTKTFIDRSPYKLKMAKSKPKVKQVYVEKGSRKNGPKAIIYENCKHTTF